MQSVRQNNCIQEATMEIPPPTMLAVEKTGVRVGKNVDSHSFQGMHL